MFLLKLLLKHPRVYYTRFTFGLNFETTPHLRLILSGDQGDLRWFRDHVRGELSHQVDLSRILPRGDAGLMDEHERV